MLMDVLRLLVPVVVVLVVMILIWAGRAMLEGAREGVAEAREEEAAAKAVQTAEQEARAQARLERFEAASAALAPADRFALNLRAPFTEIWLEIFPQEDGASQLEYLYRLTPPVGQETELKKALEEGWDITDHASAMQALAWLIDSGHRLPYSQLRRAIAAGEELRGNSREVGVVQKWEAQVGEAGGAAFDLARAVDVAAQAYALGYLSEAECWRILRQCRMLAQDLFESWETYGQSFLAGAEFWKSGGLLDIRHKRYAKSIRWLQEDPQSPWLRDPWPVSPERQERLKAMN
jgi:Na+-transporting methylmalonyl-CoA/oxaloacetate decarboxylase gamma subunit